MYFNRTILRYFVGLVIMAGTTIVATGYNLQFADEARSQRLRWKRNVIQVSLSSSLFRQNASIRPEADVSGAITRSLETWTRAANISFVESPSEKSSVSLPGKHGDGVSLITVAQTDENLLLFGGDSSGVAARTRVFFNSKGFITEADIVLNPYQQFSTDGSFGTFDLEAILTHELGHLLGLEHSFVAGAAMHANQGVNGVYGLKSFTSRTLAEDDIAGIRAIYGAESQSDNCCGMVLGKISGSLRKPVSETQVWFENLADGQVFAGVLTDKNGNFHAEGLPSGQYSIFAKQGLLEESKGYGAVENLGIVDVLRGRTVVVEKTLGDSKIDFMLQYVGFGGQLSQLPVPINGGKSYIIYIAGKNIDSDKLSISFKSPFIRINRESMISHTFGSELSAVSFEVNVSNEIPEGNYSIFATNARGETDVLIGSLSVGEFENPLASFYMPLKN